MKKVTPPITIKPNNKTIYSFVNFLNIIVPRVHHYSIMRLYEGEMINAMELHTEWKNFGIVR